MNDPDPVGLLFGGMEKLGPGDNAHTLRVLSLLPKREFRVVVDAGCGTGRQTLALAKALGTPVHAIDTHQPFLDDLARRAAEAGVGHLVQARCLDMKDIPSVWRDIDLLWSEGTAYNIGFSEALATWAPALAPGGLVVVSELSWLKEQVPDAVAEFFRACYPGMKSVPQNVAAAERAGYRVLATHALPREAWVDGYYDILGPRAKALLEHPAPAVRDFAAETVREIEVFDRSEESYGYVFYVLQRAEPAPTPPPASAGARDAEEVAAFYALGLERDRLATGPGALEFARTREMLERHLPPPPAVVADVGGGPGRYAVWLAERGYRVHLVDPVPLHVAQARAAAKRAPLASAEVGDARSLRLPDASADVVLLLGPLYHLPERADRLRALAEARRVCRPGGVVIAAAISRYASALDGIARDLFADPAFVGIVRQDLEQGQHRNATGNLDYFTTAYFHRPDELRDEIAAAALNCLGVFGLEGPGWILSDFGERWADSRKREDLLRVARALEREASVVGLSAHMLAVGIKA